MKRRNKNHTAGYSLIDVVVGIAILGLVTVPVCASLVLSLRLNESSRALMTAQLEASTAVEMLMAEGINAAEFTDGKRTLNGADISITPSADGSYYDVVVTGRDNGKEVVLTTSIRAKGGA